MTTEQTPPPPPADAPAFRLCTPADYLTAVAVAVDALAGDGSTEHLPDVTRFEAARWILDALDGSGFALVRRVEQ